MLLHFNATEANVKKSYFYAAEGTIKITKDSSGVGGLGGRKGEG